MPSLGLYVGLSVSLISDAFNYVSNYFRPDGASMYFRPDGTSIYKRP